MDILVDIIFVTIAIYLCLASFVPRIRPRWKGSTVRLGALSCIGFALVFGAMAALAITRLGLPEHQRGWFAILLLIGFLLVMIGYYRDGRAFKTKKKDESKNAA